ncbi:hypothetical protein [Ancylobacter oerskovii]|uniref:Uncharacterized protein n=1 Tax=Ancylobacter oerskovii TaxID=459519 RepID=A0ABW4Z1K6_9HYPH|nr:hypothetical protein [Ancylobacter oerskovii]MBS7545070.1 hypothetical protein [Ancylobacter oerskovii]
MNDEHRCPICERAFTLTDKCSTDIELGICHAECLAGSPVVDLETGEPVAGPADVYPYSEVSDDKR